MAAAGRRAGAIPIGPAIYGQMVFEDPDWDWRTFNDAADLAAAKAKPGDFMDAMDPDLRPFHDRGGKLILSHGWSDFGISPEATRHDYTATSYSIDRGRAERGWARAAHATAMPVSADGAPDRQRLPRRRRELRETRAVSAAALLG